jgi:hypothetical protein
LATAGESHDQQNVIIWDMLYPPRDRVSAAFKCHDGGGATAVCFVPSTNTLVTGGNKGQISKLHIHIYDITSRQHHGLILPSV